MPERAEEVEIAGSFRIFNTPHTVVPEVHLLSNGRYHVMISAAGGGYSRWKDLAVTDGKRIPTRDNWGSFCYVRDLQRDRFWSTTYQPTLRDSRRYEAIFSQAQVPSFGGATTTSRFTPRSAFRPRTTSSCGE